jgi:peptide/nickel transport system permease protein
LRIGRDQKLGRARSFLGAHPFIRSLLARLAALVLLAWGLTLIAFTLTQMVPGDPALANLGLYQVDDPALVKAYRVKYGLDKPIPQQYLLYLTHLVHGDLGVSEQSHRPVAVDLAEYIPATVELAVTTTLLAVVFGIGFGTLAATRRNKPIDHVLRVLSLAGISTPAFWLGLLALYLFFYKLGWAPGTGRLDPGVDSPPHVTGLFTVDSLLVGQVGVFINALQHLLLPAAVLAVHQIALLTRFTRAVVLDVAQEEFINTARAKGLSQVSVLRHLLRAALPPVVTIIGFLFADVLTGTVLVETIFAWPGIGRYAFQAATTLDLPAIMGVTLFVATVFIVVNFGIDTLYGVIDPRLRVA